MQKKNMGHILIIDDNPDILAAAKMLLKGQVESVQTETSPDRIPNILQNKSFDVILLDMNFSRDVTSGREGFKWLKRILEIDRSAVVILVTAYGDVDMAVRAIKEGATDFVLKPWQNEKLCATVSTAVILRQTRREADRLRERQRQLSDDIYRSQVGFIGVCPAIRRLFETIDRVSQTDASVLILGENGTGKEMVAREIHRRSQRADDVFIAVDIGSLPETLFESELFGHMRGSFTDAHQDRVGRFELADGGTLFLDEIGNIPPRQQAKLLTVLENREITRIGGSTAIPTDIRLISATNRPIQEHVASGEFRQDLFYRLNTVEIHLPPLRERGEDIPLLMDNFLRLYSKKYGKQIQSVDSKAMAGIMRYSWPGNVRELKHAVERAVIMSSSDSLYASDFAHGDSVPLNSKNGSSTLIDQEKAAIIKALQKNNHNISHTAVQLGLTRASLYRRMRKYGL